MDMSTREELIECKTVLRGKRSITIKDDDLSLLLRLSAQRDIDPVMDIELAGRAWVLIPRGDYRELRD
jgi:Holliday junction resolvase